MILNNEKAILLMVDDDDDDVGLVKEALLQMRYKSQLLRVKDGEELLSYLKGEGQYSDRKSYPLPNLIFLDLNMPKMDGKEALSIMSENQIGDGIPVLVLTTSASEIDVSESYYLGATSYIRKPVNYDELIVLMKDLGKYWFKTVDLPILNN